MDVEAGGTKRTVVGIEASLAVAPKWLRLVRQEEVAPLTQLERIRCVQPVLCVVTVLLLVFDEARRTIHARFVALATV